MGMTRSTRTIHTIHIDLLDSVLEGVESGDEVEVVLTWRGGVTRPKRLSPGDIFVLLEGESKGGRFK